jgi:hypothetical protein
LVLFEEAGGKASPKKQQLSPRRVRHDNDEDEDEVKPVERAIEARSEAKPAGQPDALPSLIRVLYFADTFVAGPTAKVCSCRKLFPASYSDCCL